jgi:hypothetical protein
MTSQLTVDFKITLLQATVECDRLVRQKDQHRLQRSRVLLRWVTRAEAAEGPVSALQRDLRD